MTEIVLHDYWRSSASYRVRIALNLAGEGYRAVPVNLLKSEQTGESHKERHPLGLVPVLEIDGLVLTQSLAIVEYLDETRRLGLLPRDSASRARVRAIAHAIAMDIHPVCNLSVVNHVAVLLGGDAEVKGEWMRKFIGERLAGVEAMLDERGPFCADSSISLADVCLVPQIYNARRWKVPLDALPKVQRVSDACDAVAAFADARPEAQPDAVAARRSVLAPRSQ